MHQPIRTRFWFETSLAAINSVLALLTVVWNDWIELAFRVDPDLGSGALERAIVGSCLLLSVAGLWQARREWRRIAASGGAPVY
jgi:hypothetical protein